jgi:hypothetical protein
VTLVPHELPDYVEVGGRQVWRPPYEARDAEIYGFVLAADRAHIDGLLEEALVEPTKGAVDYRCAHDHVVVTFATIGRLASEDAPDSLCGYLPEREVSVWCLAADTLTNRLVWYLPYVFTDSGQTVATGREVYGYPKQIGYFPRRYPDKLTAGGTTTVEALAIHPFEPEVCAELRAMISVERQSVPAGVRETVATGENSAHEFTLGLPTEKIGTTPTMALRQTSRPKAAITSVDARPPRVPASPPWVGHLFDIVHGTTLSGHAFDLVVDMVDNPTLVFLKQFRDVSCPTKACYQAVVEARLGIHLMGANYRALDPSFFEITIENWASHPIAHDIGVPAGEPLRPERAFHAQLGFDIQLGEEVWRAPT